MLGAYIDADEPLACAVAGAMLAMPIIVKVVAKKVENRFMGTSY